MKIKNKISKSRADSKVAEANSLPSADDLIKQERIRQLQRKKGAPQVDGETEAFIVDVMYGKKWEPNHLEGLPKEEHRLYLKYLQHAINILASEDRDRFLNRIESVVNEATKNNIWQAEHVDIVNALDALTREKNRLAARVEIAEKVSLSQEAIEKHIGEYFQSHHQKQRQQEFLLMRERLLSRCYKFAIDGDMKAARLFFEATSYKRAETTIQNQQNNFIQVNNVTITEEQINKLPEDKQKQMREILLMLNEQG